MSWRRPDEQGHRGGIRLKQPFPRDAGRDQAPFRLDCGHVDPDGERDDKLKTTRM